MQTIKKSADGKVMVTKRANGMFAVSQQASRWSVTARMFVNEWETVERDMIEPAAMLLFASLTTLAA